MRVACRGLRNRYGETLLRILISLLMLAAMGASLFAQEQAGSEANLDGAGANSICCYCCAFLPGIIGVTNAAATTTTLARGGLATVLGSHLAATPGLASSAPFPTAIGNATATVDGISAPLLYADATRMTFQVPFEAAPGSSGAVLVVVYGSPSLGVPVVMADYAFGVFYYARTPTVSDPVIFHSADNSLVTPDKPATPGETLAVYGTGIGKLNNPPGTGQTAPYSPPATAVDDPTVNVGGAAATVSFAGLVPGFLGLAQIRFQIPASLPSGNLPLTIQFPGDSTQTAILEVKGNSQRAPGASLSPDSLSFGNVPLGQTQNFTVAVANASDATLTVNAFSVCGMGFSIISPATPFQVASGAAATVTIRFAPTIAGMVNGTLTVTSSDAGHAALAVRLSGNGATASIGLSTSLLDFGTVPVGQTKSAQLTVRNTGSATLVFQETSVLRSGDFTCDPLPNDLLPGAQQLIGCLFQPSVARMEFGQALIDTNDPVNSLVVVDFTGTGQ
jgi:uncharacterized protein (TIGR03437 family)